MKVVKSCDYVNLFWYWNDCYVEPFNSVGSLEIDLLYICTSQRLTTDYNRIYDF